MIVKMRLTWCSHRSMERQQSMISVISDDVDCENEGSVGKLIEARVVVRSSPGRREGGESAETLLATRSP